LFQNGVITRVANVIRKRRDRAKASEDSEHSKRCGRSFSSTGTYEPILEKELAVSLRAYKYKNLLKCICSYMISRSITSLD